MLVFVVAIAYLPVCAQPSLRMQTGVSYIEHLSTGVTVQFRQKHNVSVLVGTNAFVRTYYFYNAFLQYDRAFMKWKWKYMVPRIGIKGGNSVYTNKYYRWKVVSLIPFIGATVPLRDRLDLLLEAGAAYSLEQEVTRRSFGEIGHYRSPLPEVKLAVLLSLSRKANP
jgi:hypothetical protein